MKKIKINIRDSILSQVTRSRWAGYKSRLEEFSLLPVIDTESINMSILLFDIYLLENLVQSYYDYHIYNVDYESFMEEHNIFSFDYFADSVEELDYKEEFLVSFVNSSLEGYSVSSEFVESLLFEEIDEDFIIQYYYTFLLWGPLELLYHSLTNITWNSKLLNNINKLSTNLFIFIFKLYVYFANFYTFNNLFLNHGTFYMILNKWDNRYLYYKFEQFNVQYSLLFQGSKKSLFYYLGYSFYFFANTTWFFFIYNFGLVINIFKLITYWITSKLLACMFSLSYFFCIYILILLKIFCGSYL